MEGEWRRGGDGESLNPPNRGVFQSGDWAMGGGGAQVFEGIFARNFMKRHALFWE